MTDHNQYFNYLMRRSRVGGLYRKYWLYPRLSKYMSGTVLDIGCGIGDMLNFRPGTVGVDVNPLAVEFCLRQGLDAHFMQEDILPFNAGTFDTVLLDNVLEHILDPGCLLNEVGRVLKPEGRLLIGIPGVRGWYSDSDHKIFYDEKSLLGCLGNSGFSQIKVFYSPLWRSAWLSRKLRQYCVYGVFCRIL